MVGLSGSLIKDTVKENALYMLNAISRLGIRSEDLPSPEPIEQPEATKVLIGVFFIAFAQLLFVIFRHQTRRYGVCVNAAKPLFSVALQRSS